jgi:hypothetical protein
MKKKTKGKVLSIILVSSVLTMTACNFQKKDITLDNNGTCIDKEIGESKKGDEVEKLTKEKSILLSANAKEDFNEKESSSFTLDKISELAINDENLEPICWKNSDNIIAVKVIENLKNCYEVYNIDVTKSEIKKITRINNVIYSSSLRVVNSNKLLFLDGLKLYSYDLIEDAYEEVYDFDLIKKDIEAQYKDYYIKTESKDIGDYVYNIVERKKKSEPEFIIESDIEINKLFNINLVEGSNKYVSVISPFPNSGEVIRIVDLDTKKVITSKRFDSLELGVKNHTGFKYNKEKDVFYINGNSFNGEYTTIYEYKLNNPDNLKEINNMLKLNVCSPIKWEDNDNFYFLAGNEENKNSIVRYNVSQGKMREVFKNKPEGVYSSLTLLNHTELIGFNYKKDISDKHSEESSFIGVIKGDTIKNIQKLPIEKVKGKGQNNTSILFNKMGDKFIYKQAYSYKRNGIGYTSAKFYIYEINNMESVLKCKNPITVNAVKFLGTPYTWGGSNPEEGFDCGGFVKYVYKQCGINISRVSYTQIKEGIKVSKENLKPGDLVFFGTFENPHHVGIYFGNGIYIHAPRTGDVVKLSPISRKDFLTGIRILK